MGALGGSGPQTRTPATQMLAEQKAMLVAAIGHYGMIDRERAMDIIAGISAAGFSIVRPKVTEEMQEASGVWWNTTKMFKAMLFAGDIARKPE